MGALEILISLVVLGTTYTVFQSLWARSWFRMPPDCEPPPSYPHKDPILGLDLYFGNIKRLKNSKVLEGIVQRFQEYGTTYTTIVMGRTTICTIDPRNLQTVHAAKAGDYGLQPIRRRPTLPFIGEGIFTMDGAFWEHSRALIRPSFTRANIANLPSFEIELQKFLSLIPQDGSTVDLLPLLFRLFLDTSTDFLFGESLNSLSSENSARTQEFLEAFHYGMRGVGIRIALGKFMFLYRDKKWYEAIEVAHEFADAYVNQALEFRQRYLQQIEKGTLSDGDNEVGGNEGGRHVLLHEMAKQTDNREELRHQILHIFMAGHDTTAVTISNAVFHLSRHPEIWKKLRVEILAAGDEELTFESLKQRHYLQYVVKETLRLHPPAPTDSRISLKDTVLPRGGGSDGNSAVFVPKGTPVTTSFHALHMLAECFQPDATAFRPERWETVRPGWNYLPFGGGPRVCPAQKMALTQVAYVLARMAQTWERIECRDKVVEWVEELKLTASSRNGVKIGVIPA